MQELKERIVKEGKVLPGNIIKVDGFLNHRIDTGLLTRIAEEFGKYFNMDEVTMSSRQKPAVSLWPPLWPPISISP